MEESFIFQLKNDTSGVEDEAEPTTIGDAGILPTPGGLVCNRPKYGLASRRAPRSACCIDGRSKGEATYGRLCAERSLTGLHNTLPY